MPMFYIAIYLFKPEMITIIQENPLINVHFYFLLSVCLVLSILWFGMVFFVTARGARLAKRKILQDEIEKVKSQEQKTKFDDSKLTDKQRLLFSTLTKMNRDIKRKKLEARMNKVFTNEANYELTLFYSVGYFAIAVGLNHFYLHWSLPTFLISNLLFIVFRLIYISFFSRLYKELLND
jgi:hypothetical protein